MKIDLQSGKFISAYFWFLKHATKTNLIAIESNQLYFALINPVDIPQILNQAETCVDADIGLAKLKIVQ